MEDSHRGLLRKHRMELARDLNARTATSYLYAESIFSEDDKEGIEAANTPRDKNEKLLDILPKRGPKAFDVFSKYLEDNQRHLFRLLQPVSEERIGPADQTDKSFPSQPPESKPAAKTDPYSFSSNPRSVSSTFPSSTATSQTSTAVDGQTSTTATQTRAISSTNNLPNEHDSDQGDGNRPSRFGPPSSFMDGVNQQDIYPMNSRPRGQAFIINNKDFKPSSGMEKYPRNGTDVDAEALEKLFNGLLFETAVFKNQTTKQTFEIVDYYSTLDHRRYDCFMCAFLTHGEEGLLYSTDGKIPIKELTSKFRTRQLLGKPKLFFFQACQGFDYMEGGDQPDGPLEPDRDEVDAPGNNKIALPIEADFLYAYSTVPGYYSWRNSVRGSWFAQAIVSVFKDHALSMDVMRLLTRVNAEVAKQKSNTNEYFSDNKKQIPSVISQLRKELYFFPENVVANYDGTETATTKKTEKSEKNCSIS